MPETGSGRRTRQIRASAPRTLSLTTFLIDHLFEAGLALNTHGSLVNGLTPLRAGVAGFFFNLRLRQPANLKRPAVFNCSAAMVTRLSTTLLTTLALRPVVSATELYAPDVVMAPLVFIAFAFIAFMGAI